MYRKLIVIALCLIAFLPTIGASGASEKVTVSKTNGGEALPTVLEAGETTGGVSVTGDPAPALAETIEDAEAQAEVDNIVESGNSEEKTASVPFVPEEDTEAKAEAETDADVKAETGTKMGAEVKAEAEMEAEAGAEVKVETGADAEALGTSEKGGKTRSKRRLGAAVDLGVVQDIFLGGGSYNLAIDLRAMVTEDFQIRVPVTLVGNRRSFMEEVGLQLVYYPWGRGPFFGISMFQIGFTQGSSELERVINLNEVVLGWTFEFGPGLFVEPSLSIRDPSGTFSEEYSRIKGAFPCYTTFRARINFGWYFWGF